MHPLAKNIEWLGHDCFFIHGSKKVCIDPFELKNSKRKADIILVSHEHNDHCSLEDIQKVSTEKTIIVGSVQAAQKLGKNVNVLKPGETVKVGIKITGTSAYNVNKFRAPGQHFHPKQDQKLGFIFELDRVQYYHAGDSDFIQEMRALKNIDVAFLPVSGTYVMTAKEAVQAADAIQPKLAIPMHYGSIVGSEKDAEEFKKHTSVAVEILKKSK